MSKEIIDAMPVLGLASGSDPHEGAVLVGVDSLGGAVEEKREAFLQPLDLGILACADRFSELRFLRFDPKSLVP